jgi:hypothetical protein
LKPDGFSVRVVTPKDTNPDGLSWSLSQLGPFLLPRGIFLMADREQVAITGIFLKCLL